MGAVSGPGAYVWTFVVVLTLLVATSGPAAATAHTALAFAGENSSPVVGLHPAVDGFHLVDADVCPVGSESVGSEPVGSDAVVSYDFGRVVVGQSVEWTGVGVDGDGGFTDENREDSTVTIEGPDADQFRVRPSLAGGDTADAVTVVFAPTTPGVKRAWVTARVGADTRVHCLSGTAVVAAASKGGGGSGESAGSGGSRGSSADAGSVASASGGGGGGVLRGVFGGFGRELTGSVARGVVSVVTLEFARTAVTGFGAAWVAGDGLVGKSVGVVGYVLSGVDPTAGLRHGLPAAVDAWRDGDFEGVGRHLFHAVESVAFTGAAAAGAWEGSKRARGVVHARRTRTAPTDGTVNAADSPASRTEAYRSFTAGIDAALETGFEDDVGAGPSPPSERAPATSRPGDSASSSRPGARERPGTETVGHAPDVETNGPEERGGPPNSPDSSSDAGDDRRRETA